MSKHADEKFLELTGKHEYAKECIETLEEDLLDLKCSY